jgi:nucleoside-diphosphate-sugar epimerase
MTLPDRIETEAQLEDVMTAPSPALVEALSGLGGDLLILGVGGKMGPTLARLARRGLDEAGSGSRVIGVARFTNPAARGGLHAAGVETVAADLLDDDALARLPDASHVVYLAARKFGSTGDEPLTWAMNTYLPARVAQRYREARIVALSTGNVYPLTPVASGGPTEDEPPGPVGEYAQSCLGRERMFSYFSRCYGTPVSLIRLNYAIDLRYGVLFDIASKVHDGVPVDLTMGYANVIWQGDANTAILRSFARCASPPFLLNLTGLDTLSVRWIADQFGDRFSRPATFTGTEQPTALLSNASRYARLLGGPAVPIAAMIDWVAHWVRIGGPTLNKPTHFGTRDGRF